MPREHEVDPGQAIFSRILDNLRKNLNTQKRVQGGQGPDGKTSLAPDIHFYEHVVTSSVLQELTFVTGEHHPAWGTGIVTESQGQKIIEWYGMKPRHAEPSIENVEKGHVFYQPEECDYVGVGLRFSESHAEWKSTGHGAAQKRIRLKDTNGNIWRPQIVLTIEPLSTYMLFKTNPKYLKDIGTAKVIHLPNILDCPKASKLWKACTLVPLRLVLPVVPPKVAPSVTQAVTEYRQSVQAKDTSRTFSDHNPRLSLGEEESEQFTLEQVGRRAAETFNWR